MKLRDYLKQFQDLDPELEVVLTDVENRGQAQTNFGPPRIVYSDNMDREYRLE